MADAHTQIIISARDLASDTFRRLHMEAMSLHSGLNQLNTGLGQFKGLLAGLGVSYAVKNILDTAMALQSLDYALTGIMGSAQGAQRELSFIRKTAEDLGQDFLTLTDGFKGLAAATRNTELAGEETRKLFLALSQAATVLNMSTENVNGTFFAFQQIISKGRVSAEEIRRQLGDRLYGAFQLAAQSIGVTTKELDKLLERGELDAIPFIKAFTRTLTDEFSGGVALASQSARANLNRFQNALRDLKNEAAQAGFLEAFSDALKALTETLRQPGTQEAIQGIGKGLAAITEALTGPGVLGGASALVSAIGRVADAYSKLPQGLQLGLAGGAAGYALSLGNPYVALGAAGAGFVAGQYQDLLRKMEEAKQVPPGTLGYIPAVRQQVGPLGGLTYAQFLEAQAKASDRRVDLSGAEMQRLGLGQALRITGPSRVALEEVATTLLEAPTGDKWQDKLNKEAKSFREAARKAFKDYASSGDKDAGLTAMDLLGLDAGNLKALGLSPDLQAVWGAEVEKHQAALRDLRKDEAQGRAKDNAELIKGEYELGQARLDAVIDSLRKRAAVLSQGTTDERAEAAKVNKEISELELKRWADRTAVAEQSYKLGMVGSADLIASYQAEIDALGGLAMRDDERAKRKLEGLAKIRDAQRAVVDQDIALEALQVSWMQEGPAREKAALDNSLKNQRAALEREIQDRKDLQGKKQSLLDQFDAYADRQRQKQVSKERQTELDIQIQTLKLYGKTREAKELELEKYVESIKDKGYSEIQQEKLIANERERLTRTGLENQLWAYSDFYSNLDTLSQHTLERIQDGFEDAFTALLDGTKTFGDALRDAFGKIGTTAAAQFATAATMSLASKGILAIMPGLGSVFPFLGQQAGQQGGVADALGKAKSLWDLGSLFGGSSTGGLGGWLTKAFGTSGDVLGVGMGGAGQNTLWGMSAGGWNAALGAAGVGALGGSLLTPMIYGNKGYSTLGGTLGAAAGAGAGMSSAAMAALGLAGGPWTAAALGLAGMLAGGGLGSLFGDDEDSRQPYEIPGNTLEHWKELSNRVRDYSQALRDGEIDQARFLGEFDKMAPLAAGAGEYLGNYGGIIGGTIEKLSGLTFGTQAYADVVANELNPAWIIAQGQAQNLANGMSMLDAATVALNDSVTSLLAGGDLQLDQQQQLMDQVLRLSGEHDDLVAKSKELAEIREKLTRAHELSDDEYKSLVARGQELWGALNMEGDGVANMTTLTKDLTKAMKELNGSMLAMLNLPTDHTWNWTVNYNTNGTPPSAPGTAHTGRWVSAALGSGMITRHGGGGVPLYAHAGLNAAWPAPRLGEVDIRALVGEWVISREAVDYYGNEFMGRLNAKAIPVRQGGASASASAPEINVSISFAGANFGSNPDDTAAVVEAAVRAGVRQALAEMAERGETAAVEHNRELAW
ncbi:MAG: tape measure protein [Thermodesulfobacteriota bacterium]